MDLHQEFERHAAAVCGGAGSRLQGADVRTRLDARVARARRIGAAKTGAGALAAVGVLGLGAVFVPRLWNDSMPAADGPAGSPPASAMASDLPAPSPSPSGTASASATPVDPAAIPPLGSEGYLVEGVSMWRAAGPMACEALATAGMGDEVGFDGADGRAPLPAWLETGRLYGWGDDVLVGGTPAPLAAVGQADYEEVRVLAAGFSAGPAELVLTGAAGVPWGFTVTWEERDDLPHDAPGVFAVLSPHYDCHDGVVPEGEYEAHLAYTEADGSTRVVELAPMTVVSGVPSLPEVDAAGR